MTKLSFPDRNESISDFPKIQQELAARGIRMERWEPDRPVSLKADQDEILAAYQTKLEAFMEAGGYQSADVISVHSQTPSIDEIRNKFLAEHTHTEDEVRYFIDGQGLFWFHKDHEVFSVLCQAGDLINVPAHTTHWFDLGLEPFVKAIRIFTRSDGWVAHYTGSGIDQKYNPKYD